jgi:hypothetical protein
MIQDGSQSSVEDRSYISPTGDVIPRTWPNVKSGKIPWTELDNDELSRGQLRDKNGTFSGRPPNLVPREMVGEIRRRLMEVYQDRIAEKLLVLQDVFLDIATDETLSPADRLRAAQYMTERLAGKVPDKVEITAEVKPWEGMVAGVLEDSDDAVT